jgi:hypothetical protein
MYLKYFLRIQRLWDKEKFMAEKYSAFFDLVKIDLSFNLDKLIMFLNRNNNYIIRLKNIHNIMKFIPDDSKCNDVPDPEFEREVVKRKLNKLIYNQFYDIYFENNLYNPNYVQMEDEDKYDSKSREYAINLLDIIKLNLKIYINISYKMDYEELKFILEKNIVGNNKYQYFMQIIEERLNDLTLKLMVLNLLILDFKRINEFIKKNNKEVKILKLEDDYDAFDIFELMQTFRDNNFVDLIFPLNDFMKNITYNSKVDSLILLRTRYFMNIATIVNRIRDKDLIENFLNLLRYNFERFEVFDFNHINYPDINEIFAHVILDYKRFHEDAIKNTLVILKCYLEEYKKNNADKYKELIAFLEQNKVNLIIEEISTIYFTDLINVCAKIILKDNWDLEVNDLHLHDAKKKIKANMK